MQPRKKPELQYIYISDEVGQMLGLWPISVRAYAKRYRLGEKRDDRWRYSEADIEIIQEHMRRGPGKPKKEQT